MATTDQANNMGEEKEKEKKRRKNPDKKTDNKSSLQIDILAAAADTGSLCSASDHAPGSGILAAAAPIDCTGEQDHVQLYVPGHFRATIMSAMESERPVFLPATMDVEASGGGYDPSPEYFAVDPPHGGFLAAAPMDCSSELKQVNQEVDVRLHVSHESTNYQSTHASAVEFEGPVILPVPIDVDAQASGDCPA